MGAGRPPPLLVARFRGKSAGLSSFTHIPMCLCPSAGRMLFSGMNYWPWWLGGIALASVPIVHWVGIRRMMAVSSRYTALVDGARSRQAAPATLNHVLFFVGLVAGGAISALLAGRWHPSYRLDGALLARLVPGSTLPVLLIFGGVCVGFGTRMAAGCSSGHGLVGVSRFQPGSLLATAAFFGTGVLTSFALGALR